MCCCVITYIRMDKYEHTRGKSQTMTVRVSPQLGEQLEALARDTKRSKAHLAGEAIADFVGRNGWQVARIKAALEDAKSGGPGIPHERVEDWVNSWEGDHELPPPEARL